MADAKRPALPEQGMAWDALERELVEAKRDDVDWQDGRAPAFIHYAGEEVLQASKKAFMHYFSENGLGLRAFKSLAKFESEVVDWGLGLLHGGGDLMSGNGILASGRLRQFEIDTINTTDQ